MKAFLRTFCKACHKRDPLAPSGDTQCTHGARDKHRPRHPQLDGTLFFFSFSTNDFIVQMIQSRIVLAFLAFSTTHSKSFVLPTPLCARIHTIGARSYAALGRTKNVLQHVSNGSEDHHRYHPHCNEHTATKRDDDEFTHFIVSVCKAIGFFSFFIV